MLKRAIFEWINAETSNRGYSEYAGYDMMQLLVDRLISPVGGLQLMKRIEWGQIRTVHLTVQH